ncbi:MAG: SpoIIE family protein phosphatase [Actinobacteria bacterium]|nr:SpoIIE family protein phosphatase [Actinomycetota bacterium]
MAAIFDISRQFKTERINRLKEIAEHLAPHAEEIVNSWVDKQRSFEVTPAIPREKTLSLFTTLFYGTLDALRTGNIDQYLSVQLPIIGRSLVELGFPYEHLIISVHFLEESYLPFLAEVQPGLKPERPDIDVYIIIDEFWHFWMAELTTSYFYEVKRSLTEEIEIGRSIQEAIRPSILPRIGCLDIGTFYASATVGAKIGGDIYDVVSIGNMVQHTLISDFSGKGLRAASNAANIRAMFRGFAIEDDSPLVIASRLNRVLFNELASDEFDTAFLARFDQRERTVRYVNAGHLGPVLVSAKGISVLPEGKNFALGIFKEASFGEESLILEPGSILVIYTDGITEARRDNKFFGVEGIIASVQRNQGRTVSEIAEAIWADCLDFANGKVEDDVAILVLKCE